jgi:exonuclease III
VKEWKQRLHTNGNKKRMGVAILISKKTDFKTNTIKERECHYKKIKGLIQQKHITIVTIYAPNAGAPDFTRQTLNLRRKIIGV